MKRRYTRSQRQQLKKFRTLGVLIFAAVMAIGAFIGLLFFVRPKKSTVEKRTLAKFPSFTINVIPRRIILRGRVTVVF